MVEALRRTGVDAVGDVPWGTHFCLFYQGEQDLLDTLVPYFRAGLEQGECCVWVTSEPLVAEAARRALRAVVPDLDRYEAREQLEIIPYGEFYIRDGRFDAQRVLTAWVDRAERARGRGSAGLRLSGNTFWLEKAGWQDFTLYEARINEVVAQYPMIALCTYALDRCSAAEVIDVVRNHHFALIKQDGQWRLIENSERKRAAEEQERLLTELSGTLKSIADAVLVYDQSGRIVRMNPAAEQLLGYGPAERLAPLTERVSLLRVEDASGQPLRPEATPAARALRGETVQGCVMRMRRGDREYWVLASAAPLRAVGGQLLGAVATLSDVTRLQELQAQQEEMLSLISHDLRNPLTALRGYAQMLERSLARKGLATETAAVSAILRSAGRMNSMIQDLVESARLGSGRLELRREPTNLGALLLDICDHPGTPEARARVEVECEEDLPPVLLDPERFERAVVNLIGNALKYSAPGAPVSVRLVRRGDEVVLSVADRGVGIPAADLPRLFQKLYRASTGGKAEGLGLGLYITRLIVEAHGGQVGVESEVGRGSTFTIRLPVAPGLESRCP